MWCEVVCGVHSCNCEKRLSWDQDLVGATLLHCAAHRCKSGHGNIGTHGERGTFLREVTHIEQLKGNWCKKQTMWEVIKPTLSTINGNFRPIVVSILCHNHLMRGITVLSSSHRMTLSFNQYDPAIQSLIFWSEGDNTESGNNKQQVWKLWVTTAAF